MVKWHKYFSILFLCHIFISFFNIQPVFTNSQQISVLDIGISAGPNNSASVALINNLNEVFVGIYHDNLWSYNKLSGIMPINDSFSNPFSVIDGEDNMIIFLKHSSSNMAYLYHYVDYLLENLSILSIENNNERLFFANGSFFLAYHNNSAFRIDRILLENFSLINVFDSNKYIDYTIGPSILIDMSIYYDEVVLGIEYQDPYYPISNYAGYFDINFQRLYSNYSIVQIYGSEILNNIKKVAVYETTALYWGNHGFLIDGSLFTINSMNDIGITEEPFDIIMYSEKNFFLLNDKIIQVWEIDKDKNSLNFVLEVENFFPDEIHSNYIVDKSGNIYFAFIDKVDGIKMAKFTSDEFLEQMGGEITLSSSTTQISSLLTFNNIFLIAFIVAISSTFFYMKIMDRRRNKRVTSTYQPTHNNQVQFYCSNCMSNYEAVDIFCSECGWKLE